MKTSPRPYDPFAACPVVVPHVEAEERNGRVQIRQELPPSKGVRAFLARRFAMFPFRLVCLDEQGSFYWNQIDGRRTLGEIEQDLRAHFHLEPRQSRDAVVLFTKMLMRRGLVALRLKTPAQSTEILEKS